MPYNKEEIKKMDKSRELFGLMKIPDKELLRYSRIEVGQLKSYVQELEYKLSCKNKEISRLKKELKRQRYSDNMETKKKENG